MIIILPMFPEDKYKFMVTLSFHMKINYFLRYRRLLVADTGSKKEALRIANKNFP